jgi:hypothetical protein
MCGPSFFTSLYNSVFEIIFVIVSVCFPFCVQNAKVVAQVVNNVSFVKFRSISYLLSVKGSYNRHLITCIITSTGSR